MQWTLKIPTCRIQIFKTLGCYVGFPQGRSVEILFLQQFYKNVDISKVYFKHEVFIEPRLINQSLNVSNVHS